MAERRIRSNGRPIYGRPMVRRPKARRSYAIHLGLVPRRILMLVAAILLVGFGLGQIFGIHTITSVGSTGSVVAESRVITDSSWSLGNTLTFSNSSFSIKLLAADATIKTVKTTRVWPSTLRVTVTQKQPTLGWTTGGDGYLLDADGTVIGSLSAASKLPVVDDDSNLPVKTGDVAVSPRFVNFVTGLADQIPNTGLTPSKYEIKDTTFDLYVTTNHGYQLIFDTSRAVGDEVGDLKAVQANLKQTGKTPTQYIDLRIAGRAYYK